MRKHTAAVTDAIKTIPALTSKTFVSIAPRDSAGKLPAAPYVVVHPSDGIDEQDRLSGPRTLYTPDFTLHIVGASYDNAQTVTELVKSKFVVDGFGVYLTVQGENTGRVQWSVPTPTQVDNSVTPPLVYNIVELGFTSQPL